MIKSIARFSYRHRQAVVVVWVLLLGGIAFWGHAASNAFTSDVVLKNTDSQAASDVLSSRFPSAYGSTGIIAFKASRGIDDPDIKSQVQTLFTKIDDIDQVSGVNSPYSPQSFEQVSRDGTIAYGVIQFKNELTSVTPTTISTIQKLVTGANTPDLQVDMGGEAFTGYRPQLTSEWVGVSIAIIILLIAFGSIIAMGLPIINALTGIGIGISLVGLLAHLMTLPDFSTELAAMLGIGVGIDYALLIVTRFRQQIQHKQSPEEAVVQAINTAGRSVLFAGIAVVLSLLGMLITNIGFIQALGIASAVVVAVTVLASITLIPAILGFIGHHIDQLRVPSFSQTSKGKKSFWLRWSFYLQKRPWRSLIFGMLVLLILAIPFRSIRLGSSDSSSHPTSDTTRRAYDLVSEGFGVGSNGPLLIAANINNQQDFMALQHLAGSIRELPDVASVSPIEPNTKQDAAIFQVIPKTSAQAEQTNELIATIRHQLIPQATNTSMTEIHVGGITATFNDLATNLRKSLPLFIGSVLAVSFLLLMMVFRSIVIPLKAVIMNILSIAAAYGVVVAVFQWGWFARYLGVGQAGPIDSYVPIIMFAIVFGLSMDYEVFLLSRIKEEYDASHNNRQAVQRGVAQTANVITAAAAIMVTVFASFIIPESRILKEFGLGLAVAILLDATIVRLIMVPAIMELLGKANWWFPRWLNWLPKIHIDQNDL